MFDLLLFSRFFIFRQNEIYAPDLTTKGTTTLFLHSTFCRLMESKKINCSEWDVVTIIVLRFFFRTCFAYISDFARNLNHTAEASTKQSAVEFFWIMAMNYDNENEMITMVIVNMTMMIKENIRKQAS